MLINAFVTFSTVLLLICGSTTSWAMLSVDEIARLGKDLTPVGAEMAGNAEGTIPAWTGGITEPPTGYQKGDHHPDPSQRVQGF